MKVNELIKSGKLTDAKHQLLEWVKKNPSDHSNRYLLSIILMFFGEWERAIKHLEIIAIQQPEKKETLSLFNDLIQAEKKRISVHLHQQSISFLPEPPTCLKIYEQLIKACQSNDLKTAEPLINKIYLKYDTITGTINETPFRGFFNTDTLQAFFIEAFVYNKYVCIPIEYVKELIITTPETMIDLLWKSARITTWNGIVMNCFLPVLYPETYQHPNDEIKFGKMTDWISNHDIIYKGVGQHVFAAQDQEYAILDIRKISFERTCHDNIK